MGTTSPSLGEMLISLREASAHERMVHDHLIVRATPAEAPYMEEIGRRLNHLDELARLIAPWVPHEDVFRKPAADNPIAAMPAYDSSPEALASIVIGDHVLTDGVVRDRNGQDTGIRFSGDGYCFSVHTRTASIKAVLRKPPVLR